VALADPNNPIFGSGEDNGKDGDDDDDDEDEDEDGGGKKGEDEAPKCTNRDAFPRTAPEGATSTQKICVSLANSAPDMEFGRLDYQRMPPECQSLVVSKCRQ
jgi:hypothetical protein